MAKAQKKNRNTVQTSVNPHTHSAELYFFLVNLPIWIKQDPRVQQCAYIYPGGIASAAPTYEELLHTVIHYTGVELTLVIAMNSNSVFRIPITLEWHDNALSALFPNKPPKPDTNLYDVITRYAFPVHDERARVNVVLFDSDPHHKSLSTHPHHMHFYSAYGSKKSATRFSGMVSDLLNELWSKLY